MYLYYIEKICIFVNYFIIKPIFLKTTSAHIDF